MRDAELPPGVFNYLSGGRFRGRRGDGARSPHCGRHVHGLGRRSAAASLQQMTAGALAAALHRGDGRQEPVHRHRARGSRPRGDGHRALGLRHGRTEVLGAVAAVRRPARGGRADRAHRDTVGRDPASATRACARTGSAPWSTPMRTATTRATSTSSAHGARPCDAAGGSCVRTAVHRVTTSSRCLPRRRPRIRCGGTEMFLPILMAAPLCGSRRGHASRERHRARTDRRHLRLRGRHRLVPRHIEAGVTYANRAQGATTGAWPGYQPFGGWKGSGSTGKAIASFYYLPLYLREQSRTVVE